MITTFMMRRQRSNVLTLRFDDKQVKGRPAISGESRRSSGRFSFTYASYVSSR